MKQSKIIMAVAALLLLLLFIFPLWNITLEAPQYPEPIGMNIHINKIADMNPNDVQNINLMNHYIGMKNIPTDMIEFTIFPIVVLVMCLLGLISAFLGNYKLFLVWFLFMSILGIAGMVDFYMWEHDYGSNLSHDAAIKFTDANDNPMVYQPPLIGTKTILNFIAHSYPRLGAVFLFASIILSLIAFYLGKKSTKKTINI